MNTSAPDFGQLKSGMKATWMAGDFSQIAQFTATEAENFVARIGIPAGSKVLDVACGTGNTAIPAAKAGASVTGVDIATNLLEKARTRAAREEVNVEFKEGDAEDLPFPDATFRCSPDDVRSDVCAPSGQSCSRVAARVQTRRADRDGELDAAGFCRQILSGDVEDGAASPGSALRCSGEMSRLCNSASDRAASR